MTTFTDEGLKRILAMLDEVEDEIVALTDEEMAEIIADAPMIDPELNATRFRELDEMRKEWFGNG